MRDPSGRVSAIEAASGGRDPDRGAHHGNHRHIYSHGRRLAGNLRTLTLGSKLEFVPETNKSSNSAPDFRIFLAGFEAGAAWRKTARESGRNYWSVKLDDPAFAAPLYASLVKTEDGTPGLLRKPRCSISSGDEKAPLHRPAATCHICALD